MAYEFQELTEASTPTATVGSVSAYELSEQQPTPSVDNFVKFSSPNSFRLETVNQNTQWNGTMQYSYDNGQNWSTFSGGGANSGYDRATSSYILLLRGIGNSHLKTSNDSIGAFRFTSGTDISVSGNLESLLDYTTVALGNHPTMDNYCFAYLFSGTPITDASDLVLPIPSTEYCFANMFRSCTSLVYSIKNLNTITTQPSCCRGMFYGCSNMITIPRVDSGVDLASYSCREMFRGCSKIKISTTQDSEYINEYKIPTLSNANATNNMFYSTGGSFTGAPTANTTYYTSNTVV